MVSERVSKRRSYSGEYRRIGDRRRIELVRVLENKRKKASYPGDYRRRHTIRASTGEYWTDRESNPSEYQKIQDRNDGIRARWYPGEYQREDRIRASTGELEIDKASNPCEYRRIKERKHPTQATTKEDILSGRVSEITRQTENRIRPSTRESKIEMMVSGRVPEKRSYSGDSYSGEYWRIIDRRGINPCKYRRIQERKDGIRASSREEIVFGRATENRRQTTNRIHVSTKE
ncbi:hypothetical protein PVL29_012007 [Vitis rotundifolia]|uniref:Uncharacterized protein n=1 Tax=Vitis rotundifolia TaxID=103349 RepID=A0AA38ZQH4_VITRO|nr:hypothetical protein PVL29_012007 [Vitis rotundifolia]